MSYGLSAAGCQLVEVVKLLKGVDLDDFLLEVPHPVLLEVPAAGPLPMELGFPPSMGGEAAPGEGGGGSPLDTVKVNVSEMAGLRRSKRMQTARVHLLAPKVEGTPVAIGRAGECDVVLDSEGVSRQHAILHAMAGNWLLEDLGSHNGTHVDGNPLDKGQKVTLSERHQVLFGSYRAVFLTPELLFELASMLGGRR